MVVTQRSREIALLRAVGATRRQVLRSLMLEAMLLGSAASLLGIGLGVGVAKGLGILMDALGFALPSTSLQLEPRTIVVALVVGTLTTVLAALVPARRATKVLPVEALRESTPGATSRRSAAPSSAWRPRRSVWPACCPRCTAEHRCPSSPSASSRCWQGCSSPCRWRSARWPPSSVSRCGCADFRESSREQNARRNPRRTSSTAAALMIGLALVVSMSVFASSLKASYGDVLAGQMDADLFIKASSAQGPGFSPNVGRGGPGGVRRRRRLTHRLGRGAVRGRTVELLGGGPGHGRARSWSSRYRKGRSRTSPATESWSPARRPRHTAGSWETSSARSSRPPGSTP